VTGTRFIAAARNGGLLRFLLLFGAAFVATFSWLKFGEGARAPSMSVAQIPEQAPTSTPDGSLIVPALHQQAAVPADGTDAAAPLPKPLPAAHLATLVEAGISADDSEQRSLAIMELAQAPVEQSLAGLIRILRENRDTRSRMTALEALMGLPDSPQVREQRQQLLDLLSRDPDTSFAAAVRAAAAD
jgi:hypothetical protein